MPSSSLELFGEAAIVPGEPSVAQRSECIYVPFSKEVFFDRDPLWGIYDSNGNIISEASYMRGPALDLVGQSRSRCFDEDIFDIEDGEYIYFGPLIPHYGHFLVSSLARSWFATKSEFDGCKLLCHSDHEIQDHFRGYMGILTSALGFESGRFAKFDKPTRLTNLTIPSPAFLEQKLAYSAFAEPMHRIGDALRSGSHTERNSRPVWLSKSRMGVNSVAHIRNEVEIENALRERGFDIIFPEQLTLTEQVNLFSTRSVVSGFVGSAFHSHIFSRNPPRMVCMTLDPYVNTNLLMLDRLNGVDVTYRYPSDNISSANVPGYNTSRSIDNVKKFVSDLMDAVSMTSNTATIGYSFAERIENRSGVDYDENCVPDHQGESYIYILEKLHSEILPESYLEIGTMSGDTISLSRSSTIAISSNFQLNTLVMDGKQTCLLFQMSSDEFFRRYVSSVFLEKKIDLSFIDSMRCCESLLRDFINVERNSALTGVIALHNCLPVEAPMTDRRQNGTLPLAPHRAGWWTGDMWRALLAIKRHRTDLKILCLDAAPTGLALISGLDPSSTLLEDRYDAIVQEMMTMSLAEQTVAGFLREMDVTATTAYKSSGALAKALLPRR